MRRHLANHGLLHMGKHRFLNGMSCLSNKFSFLDDATVGLSGEKIDEVYYPISAKLCMVWITGAWHP